MDKISGLQTHNFFFKPESPLHKTSMCQVRIKLFLYSSKEINKDKNKKMFVK